VDDVEARRGDVAPDLVERELTGDDAAGSSQKQLEQVELACAERQVAAAAPSGTRAQIDEEVAVREDLTRLAPATQEGADPSAAPAAAAALTAYPSASSVRPSMRRIGGSSSTTRIAASATMGA